MASHLATARSLVAQMVSLGRFVVVVSIGIGIVIGPIGCAQDAPLDWDQVGDLIDAHFPGLPTVTTEELQNALAADRPVVLLDARKADEFAVSHLQGARRAASVEDALALLSTADTDSLIVAYCSVGYRSAALVQGLRDRGIDAVNLEGSIFRWANENRPVYRGAVAVREVHPFDDPWGSLLDRGFWVFEPIISAP